MPGYRGRMGFAGLRPLAHPPAKARGGFGVRLTATGIDATIARMQSVSTALAEQADQIIASESETAKEQIQALWPVKTGLSKASWRVARLALMKYRIENPVWYVPMVHYKATPRDAVLVQTELPQILSSARERIAARIRALIDRLSAPGRGAVRGRQMFGGGGLQPPPARAVGR